MSRKNRRPCQIVARARRAAWKARMSQWADDSNAVIPPAEWNEADHDLRADLKRTFEDIVASTGIPTATIVKTQAHVTPRRFHHITGRYAGPGPEPARADIGGVEFVADLSPGSAQQISWIAPIDASGKAVPA